MDIKIEDLWKMVNAKAERQKAERQEMVRLRLNEQAIREALSSLAAKPKLSDLLDFLRKIREVVK